MRVRWIATVVLLIFLGLALGGLEPQRSAVAQSTADCSGIPGYVRDLSEAYNAFDLALLDALTAISTHAAEGTPVATSDGQQGIVTAADELVKALEGIVPPPVATHYHRTLLELDRLIAQWLHERAEADLSPEVFQEFEEAIAEAAERLEAYGTFALSTCSDFQHVLDLANPANPTDEGAPEAA